MILFSIQNADVTTFEADVIALKYAQGLHGADRAMVSCLNMTENDIRATLPVVGSAKIFPGQSKIKAQNVMFISVAPLADFNYANIQQFAFDALKFLQTASPNTRHLALTLHGVGYGLDESAALRSEVAGCIQAIETGQCPYSLEKISFVEQDQGRAQRLQKVLSTVIPQQITVSRESEISRPSTIPDKPQIQPQKTIPPTQQHIFVAMPFSEDMEDIFYYGIQKSVHAAGYLCERMDFSSFTGDIIDKMQERIETASYVIAELTTGNPNVFLEVGYAWGKNRPTILLSKDVQKLPFDVRSHRCLIYSSIRDLEISLARELQGLIGGAQAQHFDLALIKDSQVITTDMIKTIQKQYQLSWNGTHGYPHWIRVYENGLHLSKINGANKKVVELFALLHDSQRCDEGKDKDHGKRAAEFINTLPGIHDLLSETEQTLLKFACVWHSEGLIEADITIQTCWDADRLDLGRVGKKPKPDLLCTTAARQPEVIEWAYRRSLTH